MCFIIEEGDIMKTNGNCVRCGSGNINVQADYYERTFTIICKACGFIDKYLIDSKIVTKLEFPDGSVAEEI